MDSKNVIAAISLSAAVIILYGLFFAPPPPNPDQINNEKNKIEQSGNEAPSLDQNVEVSKLSREEAIENEDRINFENSTVIGSISLVGASIDDLTFKKYTNTLNGDDNVVLLNPKKIENGYYVETGWATTNKDINVPNSKSVWKLEGNNKLSPNSPVKISWTNDQNIKLSLIHISEPTRPY